MTITVSPAESDILSGLRSFILSVSPGIAVVQGQANRVAPPSASTYVVMWPIYRNRLATNLDDYVDTAFMASIAGTVMTVTEMLLGSIKIGATLFGVDVAAGSSVQSQLSGAPGGVGTYQVTPSQSVTSQKIASGELDVIQETDVVIQCDVHGRDLASAGDTATTIATMFRDDYAVTLISGLNASITPLYADSSRQIPFINDQQQYETRWCVDFHLQANQTVYGLPQQFFDTAKVGLIDVDAVYPP